MSGRKLVYWIAGVSLCLLITVPTIQFVCGLARGYNRGCALRCIVPDKERGQQWDEMREETDRWTDTGNDFVRGGAMTWEEYTKAYDLVQRVMVVNQQRWNCDDAVSACERGGGSRSQEHRDAQNRLIEIDAELTWIHASFWKHIATVQSRLARK